MVSVEFSLDLLFSPLVCTLLRIYRLTTAASNVQFDMGGAAAISSICDGANPLTWLIVRIGGIANGLGLAIIGIATLALAIWNKRRIHKEALELHTSDTAE